MARQLRDGNVPVAILLVSHDDAAQAAGFVIDALCRYLLDRLRMQLEASELVEENHHLRKELTPRVMDHDIVTISGKMEHLIRQAVRAAPSSATVLLQGETGTGKELFARLIHSHSTRSHMPMVSINIGSLNPSLIESELFGHVAGAFSGAHKDRKGLFEVANGGTLFLDEIGEMTMEAQVRLLRALQERTITRVGSHQEIPIDVRIIAASHRNLEADTQTGKFRQDLFYRLNVVSLQLPSLRDRPEDIPLLINHFLHKFNREHYKCVEDIPQESLDILTSYHWPGNIRELENCIQKVVVMTPDSTFFRTEFIPGPIRAYGKDPRHRAPLARAIEPTSLEDSIEHWAAANGPDIHRAQQEVERC